MKRWFETMRAKAAAWRLPVRFEVPCRDDLIAYGLMALSVGLIIGVAIGPAMGVASNAVSTVLAPPAVPEESTTSIAEGPATSPELQAPAGSEVSSSGGTGDDSSLTADTGGGSGIDAGGDVPVAPPDDSNRYNDVDAEDPVEPEDEPAEAPGSPLKGTVVGSWSGGRSFAVADASGNLLTLNAKAAPALGARISTRIDPLTDGTFREVGSRVSLGERTSLKLRGVVSYRDEAGTALAISGPGVSLAVDATAARVSGDGGAAGAGAGLVSVGSYVETKVAIEELADPGPDPEAPAPNATGPETLEPAPVPVDAVPLKASTVTVIGTPGEVVPLNGPVIEVDQELRRVLFAADSQEQIPATVTVGLKASFDLATVEAGRQYWASATRLPDGSLRAEELRRLRP